MEGDETEMSTQELRTWIRGILVANQLISSGVQEKCNLLQSLLERRAKRTADLARLLHSVAACEAMVMKQYSSLGWEYRDTDSDADDKTGSQSGLASPLPKLHKSENLLGHEGQKSLKREPVVVLTRLSTQTIRSFSPRVSEDHDTAEPKDVSDTLWKPGSRSSDSDFAIPVDKSVLKRRRKGRKRKAAPPPGSAKDKDTKTAPRVLQEELRVNASVVARKRAMCWQKGKIQAIVTKEDGRLKYKVHFEPRGKSLVSAHHIALDYPPQLDQLLIGSRVLVKFPPDQCNFCPGIMGELPVNRNHMRFLVFMDDETPVYVGLPSLRLVNQPLKDPLDDIPDGCHKNFIKGYIKIWPYPPKTNYIVGHKLNAELDGVVQMCEVQTVDCSLMQVVFPTNQETVWLYRGSPRLEHIINLKKPPEIVDKDKKKTISKLMSQQCQNTAGTVNESREAYAAFPDGVL
ncbi:histone-lysine N-methyltransferase SETDB1-B-like [Spinachia spinachia]